ncbi:hypothetical protein Ancab_021613 [Ancistrocladus abbreviatus]
MEEYVEVPSDTGISFNVKPKMKALEKARDAILSGKFDQVRVNLPIGDRVGHTGDIEVTIHVLQSCWSDPGPTRTIGLLGIQRLRVYPRVVNFENASNGLDQNPKHILPAICFPLRPFCPLRLDRAVLSFASFFRFTLALSLATSLFVCSINLIH